jgi:hypothetical protein
VLRFVENPGPSLLAVAWHASSQTPPQFPEMGSALLCSCSGALASESEGHKKPEGLTGSLGIAHNRAPQLAWAAVPIGSSLSGVRVIGTSLRPSATGRPGQQRQAYPARGRLSNATGGWQSGWQLSAFSSRLSAVSSQLAAISSPLAAGQLSADCRLLTAAC